MDLLIILIIVLAVVFMIRGPKTLPKWGAAIGKGVRGAKEEAGKAQAEIQARASGESTNTDAGGDRPT